METNPQNNERSSWSDDAFTSSTIEECKKEFEACENDIDRFVDNKEKLSLLKSCIVLLNRLENTCEDLFAGRVLIFLARAIPLFDQSGVNARSDFSTKQLPKSVLRNLNEISSKNTARDKEQIAMMIDRDIEEGETLTDDDSNDSPGQQSSGTNNNNDNNKSTNATENKPTTEEDADKLFERFWNMQQYLDQPNLIYDKNAWLTFRTQLASFVARMEQPTRLKVWNLRTSYMTDPKSLSLQLNDINMRRCFLVQLLIILQYFELPVDTRSSELVMDRMHLDWASKLTKKIHSILGSLPNQEEGERFLGLVKHILKRELIWNRWKNEKCKEPKEPEEDDEIVMMGSTYHKKRKISDELFIAKSLNLHVIGSPVMSRLWSKKQDQDFHQPALETYLNVPVERQSDSFKDPNVSFRLLRLLRRSPDFFTQTTNPIQSLDEYLKSLARSAQEKESGLNNSTTTTTTSNPNPPVIISTSAVTTPTKEPEDKPSTEAKKEE